MAVKIDRVVLARMIDVGIGATRSRTVTAAIRAVPAEYTALTEEDSLGDAIHFLAWIVIKQVGSQAGERTGITGGTAGTPGVVDPVGEPLIGLRALADVGRVGRAVLIRRAVE